MCGLFAGIKNDPGWMAQNNEPSAAKSTVGGGTAKRHSKEVVACDFRGVHGYIMGSNADLMIFDGVCRQNISGYGSKWSIDL